MNRQEAMVAFQQDRPRLERLGAILPGVTSYLPDEFKENYELAMDAMPHLAQDAQPELSTTPNSAIPAFLTTFVDPNIIKIVFSPNMAAQILGEQKKGDWLTETAMFTVVEHDGEVSTYGDFNENGHAGANTNFPQRQSYLFQVVKEYGERELARAGLARLNWVSEVDAAAATVLNKFQNLTYFFGLKGLQLYGLINDPGLSASLTPAVKANGGTQWIKNGEINATANEVYEDIQALFIQVVKQSGGTIDKKAQMKLAMSPDSAVALTATNSFNVNVEDLLKKNFPNLSVETAVQYGAITEANPQGVAAGNLVQLIVDSVEGQQTGFCAFNEKLRSHPIVRGLSSFKQKLTAGTFGAVIQQPMAISSMVGV